MWGIKLLSPSRHSLCLVQTEHSTRAAERKVISLETLVCSFPQSCLAVLEPNMTKAVGAKGWAVLWHRPVGA